MGPSVSARSKVRRRSIVVITLYLLALRCTRPETRSKHACRRGVQDQVRRRLARDTPGLWRPARGAASLREPPRCPECFLMDHRKGPGRRGAGPSFDMVAGGRLFAYLSPPLVVPLVAPPPSEPRVHGSYPGIIANMINLDGLKGEPSCMATLDARTLERTRRQRSPKLSRKIPSG